MAAADGRRTRAPVKIRPGERAEARKALTLPAQPVEEVRTVLDELIGARNVAATVCIALPNVYPCLSHWELADTLHSCVVRVLDGQIERLRTLVGDEPKRRRRGAK